MKVKVLNRCEKSLTRERAEDIQQVHRNLDPALHPFDKAKEYKRAVNAAKLERVFAKPFIAALEHDEAVYSIAKNPKRLNCILAGCGDGTIRLWDVPARRYDSPSILQFLLVRANQESSPWRASHSC
jgi:WD repeat and SOF domain-containing protein 1